MAVVEQLGLGEVVLIGHSMGGDVIVEAALRLGDQVAGLIWVTGPAATFASVPAFYAIAGTRPGHRATVGTARDGRRTSRVRRRPTLRGGRDE